LSDARENPFTGRGPAKIYRDNLAAGRLELQICESCARQVFPPNVLCPQCGATRLRWEAASGAGTVYSTTVVHERPEQGGNRNIALVDLAEGARMMSRVEGVAPEAVRIGMRVKARIAAAEGGPLVVFDPA
jgi:uncharacterized OB-fold protein